MRILYLSGSALTLFVIAVGGDFVPLSRFFLPAYPALLLVACWALATQARRACGIVALVGTVLLQHSQLERSELYAGARDQTDRWTQLGRTFDATLAPNASIATAPVGAIGYYSKRRIIDLLGRTHRAFLDLEPDLEIAMKGHHRHSAAWVLSQEPDLIVLGNGLLFEQANGRPELVLSAWEGDFLEEPAFRSSYRAMQMPVEGSYRLVFFLRNGAATPAGATPAG